MKSLTSSWKLDGSERGRTAQLAAALREIARLQKQLAKVREALRPFAILAVKFNSGRADDEPIVRIGSSHATELTLGDLRRCCDALADEKED